MKQITYEQDSLAQVTFMCPWGSKTAADLRNPPPPKSKDKLVWPHPCSEGSC